MREAVREEGKSRNKEVVSVFAEGVADMKADTSASRRDSAKALNTVGVANALVWQDICLTRPAKSLEDFLNIEEKLEDTAYFSAAVICPFQINRLQATALRTTPAGTLHEFVRMTLRRLLSPAFLHQSCVVKNPLPGKVKLVESKVYEVVTSNCCLLPSPAYVAAAAMNTKWQLCKPVELQRSLRQAIKGAKFVGPGVATALKGLQEARKALREEVITWDYIIILLRKMSSLRRRQMTPRIVRKK